MIKEEPFSDYFNFLEFQVTKIRIIEHKWEQNILCSQILKIILQLRDRLTIL